MPSEVTCPRCGASVYLTDAQCLACGLQLDEGHAADLAPTPQELEAPPPVPEAAPDPLRRPWEVIVAVVLADTVGALWLLFIPLLLLAAYSGGISVTWTHLGVLALFALVPLGVAPLVWRGSARARWALSAVLALEAVVCLVIEPEDLSWAVAIGLAPPVALLFTARAKAFCSR